MPKHRCMMVILSLWIVSPAWGQHVDWWAAAPENPRWGVMPGGIALEKRPPRSEHDPYQRLHHLQLAIEHLQSAGMQDEAQRLMRIAQELKQQLAPPQPDARESAETRHVLRDLHQTLRSLRQAVRQLNARVEQLEAAREHAHPHWIPADSEAQQDEHEEEEHEEDDEDEDEDEEDDDEEEEEKEEKEEAEEKHEHNVEQEQAEFEPKRAPEADRYDSERDVAP